MVYSTHTDVQHTFKVNGSTLLKVLKGLKLDESVYLKLTHDGLKVKTIDFKQCLGVIYTAIPIDGFATAPLYLCVNVNDLCKMLENMDSDLTLTYEPYNKVLKLNCTGSTTYTLKCESNDKVRLYHQLRLIDEFEKPVLQFKINDLDLFNGFKAVCAVENIINFHYIRDQMKLILKSKKVTSISSHQWIDEMKELTYSGSEDIYNFQIYYVPTVFSPLLRQNQLATVSVYDKYVVIRIGVTTIHIPLR